MSEVKSVATRVGYGKALVELGEKRDDFLPVARNVLAWI